jgi:hypothetical protein
MTEPRLTFRIEFTLSAPASVLRAMLAERGGSWDEFIDGAVDDLTDDLNDALPLGDWEPLERSPFTIELRTTERIN